MKVDYALVLAAGKGTRMGDIGKKVPKILWPVFKKSILELEINYCEQFHPQKVFVNLFNFKDQILSFSKKNNFNEEAEFIIEEEELDIGGAVHNLAKRLNYDGKLLIINSDQFIMLTEEVKSKFYEESNKRDGVLLTYNVKKSDLYNGLVTVDNKIVGYKKNDEYLEDETVETYTGMAIINLSALRPIIGKSSFFDTVANFNELNIGSINIDKSKYWDFGTIRRYYNSMFSILPLVAKNSEDKFIKFLLKNNAISEELVTENSYNSKIEKTINLCSKVKNEVSKSIYLGDSVSEIPEQDCIVFGDLIELVDYPH